MKTTAIRNLIYLSFSIISLVSCTQTLYLSEIDDKSQIIKNELLDKKVEIHLKNGSVQQSYIHNVKADSLLTVSYDKESELYSVNGLSFNDLSRINNQNTTGSGMAGFVLGFTPVYLIISSMDNFYFQPTMLVLPLPTGLIGWIFGNSTEINKIYNFENPSNGLFKYGINLGLTFSQINKPLNNNQWTGIKPSYKIGNDLGLFLYQNLSENFSLHYTLSYLHSGARWGGYPILEGDYIDYDMSYLNFSVRIKSNKFLHEISRKLMICAGLFYDFNLSASQTWVVENHYHGNPDNLPHIRSDFSNEINKDSFGVLFGLQSPFFYDEMRVNFLWHYTITKLYKKNPPKYLGDFLNKKDFHKQMFTFSIDYLFN